MLLGYVNCCLMLFSDEETKRLMTELGSDTYTYSQVAFNYEGQPVVGVAGDMTAVGGGEQQQQGAEYLENYQLQQGEQTQEQLQLQQQQQQEDENSGYMPEADEDTYVPPAELNVPQGMVVVSRDDFELELYVIFIYTVGEVVV